MPDDSFGAAYSMHVARQAMECHWKGGTMAHVGSDLSGLVCLVFLDMLAWRHERVCHCFCVAIRR